MPGGGGGGGGWGGGRKKIEEEACFKIVKKDKSTQMRELNEKWLP